MIEVVSEAVGVDTGTRSAKAVLVVSSPGLVLAETLVGHSAAPSEGGRAEHDVVGGGGEHLPGD